MLMSRKDGLSLSDATLRPDSGLAPSPFTVQDLLKPHRPTSEKPAYCPPRRASYFKPISLSLSDQTCGSGAFGVVYKKTLAGRSVAVKVIKNQDLRVLDSEASLLKSFKHPQIIRLIGVLRNEKAIIMPFLNKGSFERYAVTEKRAVSSISPLLYNVADALNYLHHKGFVYRDLKLSNVMLNQQGEQLEAVIVDLGSVKKTTDPIAEIGTTPAFLAPEVVNAALTRQVKPKPTCQPAHDMYAFGLLMLAAINQGEPFQENLSTINLGMILFGKMPALKITGKTCASDSRHAFFNFAHQCASRKPESRPSASDAMDYLEESPRPFI